MSAVISENQPPHDGADSPEPAVLEQLKAANFFLRTAIDQISDGLMILRAEALAGAGPRILYHNTQMAGIVCAEPQSGLRDRHVTELVASQQEAEELLRVLGVAVKDGTAEWTGGLKTLYGSGVARTIWCVRAVQNTHGVLLNFTITVRAVKEHKPVANATPPAVDADARSRNESLAFAARGMAHDVNNILGIIGVKVSQAMLSQSIDNEAAKLLDEALIALKRAQSLTSSVLKLAKAMPVKREPINVMDLIRDTVTMLRSGNAVKIDIHGEPGLSAAFADSSRIGQVLQNLIINGIQCMKGVGRMEIIVRNARVAGSHSRLAPGSYVEIIVRDRGPGIPPEIADRLLQEPITTKTNGNGVGLVTCRRIVEEHGGEIRLSTMVGTGSEFTIFIPATSQAPVSAISRARHSLIPGEGVILLVDDEPDLVTASVAVLKRCGYRVYATGDGREAVEVYKNLYRAERPVDAVIMDFTLCEGISGQEAAAEIREFDRRSKIIASSGGVVEQMRQEILALGFCDVLPKPYTADVLSEVVHRVITGGSRGSLAA